MAVDVVVVVVTGVVIVFLDLSPIDSVALTLLFLFHAPCPLLCGRLALF